MKKIIPLLLSIFFLANICFAQQRIEYANFIQTDTAIKWAAVYNSYVNLTPTNPNFNVRNFYVNKLKKQGTTAYIQDSSAFAVTSATINYEDYRSSTKKRNYDEAIMNWYFNYDEKLDMSTDIFNKESNLCDTCMLANKFSFFNVKQLLYYKNSHFQIRNILFSPVIYKKSGGADKQTTEYFETASFAFNDPKNDEGTVPPDAKFIGRSCNTLVLRPSAETDMAGNDILTKHSWNLAFLLYKDIKKKILKAYDTEKSIYPNTKSILDYRKIETYKMEPYVIAMFDSLGGETGFVKKQPEIVFDSLYNYTLIQDFYFDFVKEKLYSKLVALAPRMPVVTSQGIFIGYTDYWGVIFPEEKKKIAKKTK